MYQTLVHHPINHHTTPYYSVLYHRKCLLSASSVLTHLVGKLESDYKFEFQQGRGAHPPEVDLQFCTALASLFKANAQAMAAVKSVHANSGTANLRCRLCLGVVNRIKSSMEDMRPNKIMIYPTIGSVVTHAALIHEVFMAQVYYQAGHVQKETKDTGIAIAYAMAAKVWRLNRFIMCAIN